VLGLLSIGAALAVAVTYSAMFGLLFMGAALAIAALAMLDSRPVRSIPQWGQLEYVIRSSNLIVGWVSCSNVIDTYI
jgi:hypothetical protein